MRNFFFKAAYFIVVLLSRTIFRPALKAHDAEERKKAMAILEAVELPPEDIEKIQEMLAQKSGVDLEIVVDQFVSIATRMLSEDVDDEYIRLCYNWEE
jgi:hypothetical protein